MDPVRRGVHGPGVSVFGSPVIFRLWAAEVEARRQSPLSFKEIFREANIAKKKPSLFLLAIRIGPTIASSVSHMLCSVTTEQNKSHAKHARIAHIHM